MATIEDEETRNITAISSMLMLAHPIFQEGFDPARQWLASADLTPMELASFGMSLPTNIKMEETAQWIEWSSRNYSPAQADRMVRRLVRRWASAGKWLFNAPSGTTKISAICSFAETVSCYDPETAAQWAVTLPPGRDRDATFKNFHANWPQDDPAGKHAFAEQHGIK